MSDIFKRIEQLGVLPELTIDDPFDAIGAGEAIMNGGISMAEITFRTKAAGESIRMLNSACPDMLIGAGTILSTLQVDEAVAAGAKFIVSPGISTDVVKYCKEKDIPIIPGVATPTDIETAIRLGIGLVKFFPAESNGGIKALKAMSEPYPKLRFMPSGGINEDNVANYLKSSKVLAVAGNWMCTKKMITSRNLDEIEEKCRRALRMMLGFEFDHIGIHFHKDEDAMHSAQMLSAMLDVPLEESNNLFRTGSMFELLKPQAENLSGHLALKTNHLGRALNHIMGKGIEVDEESLIKDEEGRIISVTLKREIGGIKIRLIQSRGEE